MVTSNCDEVSFHAMSKVPKCAEKFDGGTNYPGSTPRGVAILNTKWLENRFQVFGNWHKNHNSPSLARQRSLALRGQASIFTCTGQHVHLLGPVHSPL